jgi:hypothetical protein
MTATRCRLALGRVRAGPASGRCRGADPAPQQPQIARTPRAGRDFPAACHQVPFLHRGGAIRFPVSVNTGLF